MNARRRLSHKRTSALGSSCDALILRSRGSRDQAFQELEIAIQLKPDFEQALYNRAVMLREKGQQEQAKKEMEPIAGLIQFREKLAQAKSLTLRASTHVENHEPDAALSDLASAMGFWKGNPAAYYLQGLAFEQKGDLAPTV